MVNLHSQDITRPHIEKRDPSSAVFIGPWQILICIWPRASADNLFCCGKCYNMLFCWFCQHIIFIFFLFLFYIIRRLSINMFWMSMDAALLVSYMLQCKALYSFQITSSHYFLYLLHNISTKYKTVCGCNVTKFEKVLWWGAVSQL